MSDVYLTIRNTRVYNQMLVSVEPNVAYRELMRVVLWRVGNGRTNTTFLEQCLMHAFCWSDSPQGKSFWRDIYDKSKEGRC